MGRLELLGSIADSRSIRRHRQTAAVIGRSIIISSQRESRAAPKHRLCIVIDAVQNVIADSLGQLRGIVPGFRILLIQVVLQGAVRLSLENRHHEFTDIQADPPVVSGAPLLRRSHQILREVPHQLFAIQPLDSLIQLRLDVRQPQTALGVGGGRAGRRGSQPLLVCLKGLQQIVQHFRQQGKVPTVQILQLFPEFPQRVLHVCAFPHAIIGPDIIPDRLHVVVIGPLVADAKETFRAEIGAGLDKPVCRTVQIRLLVPFLSLDLLDRAFYSRFQVIAVAAKQECRIIGAQFRILCNITQLPEGSANQGVIRCIFVQEAPGQFSLQRGAIRLAFSLAPVAPGVARLGPGTRQHSLGHDAVRAQILHVDIRQHQVLTSMCHVVVYLLGSQANVFHPIIHNSLGQLQLQLILSHRFLKPAHKACCQIGRDLSHGNFRACRSQNVIGQVGTMHARQPADNVNHLSQMAPHGQAVFWKLYVGQIGHNIVRRHIGAIPEAVGY